MHLVYLHHHYSYLRKIRKIIRSIITPLSDGRQFVSFPIALGVVAL